MPQTEVKRLTMLLLVAAALASNSCRPDEGADPSGYPTTAYEALQGLQQEYRALGAFHQALQGLQQEYGDVGDGPLFGQDNCRFFPVEDGEATEEGETPDSLRSDRKANTWEARCSVDGETAVFRVGATKLLAPVPEMGVWPINRPAFRLDAGHEIFNFYIDCLEMAKQYEIDAPRVDALCGDVFLSLDEYVPSRRPLPEVAERCEELNSLSEEEWQALDIVTKELYGLGCGPP